jgi:DNA polymerase (family 10)
MEPSTGTNNRQVAAILYKVAELLNAKGEQFKPQAYVKAARSVEALQENIDEVSRHGALEDIPGIGTHIAAKIREIVDTGHLAYLEKLQREIPGGVRELAQVEGIGPKRAQVLATELGITSLKQLEEAAAARRVRHVPGFGEQSEKKILSTIRARQHRGIRVLLSDVLPVAEEIVTQLSRNPATHRISLAGSIRRMKETIGDVDIVATSPMPDDVMAAFCSLSAVGRVIERGPTRSSVVLTSGLQVDLRVVDEDQFGAALLYFTGSKEHNIALRRRALGRNWRLNEYGITDRATNTVIAGRNEQGMYRALGLPYIAPELRENRGEIEAADAGTLPDILLFNSVKGDLHVHTAWGDGAGTVKDMAVAAQTRGYDYIAVCDHIESPHVARGLDGDGILRQQAEIEQVNRELDGITVLAGIECGIGENGALDMSNTVLRDLDIVIGGIHAGLDMEESHMTERLLAALQNDPLDIIAHPTGRILLQREPAGFDLAAVSKAAAGLGVLFEINAFPNRLDLPDTGCITAQKHGAHFALGSDARSGEGLRTMNLGIATARRGWLTAKDVVNTLPLKELRMVLG